MASIKGMELMAPQVEQDDELIAAIEARLADRAMVVRSAAADSLGVLQHRPSIVKLVAALNDEYNFYRGRSLPVRRHIIEALGKMGGQESVFALIDCMAANKESDLSATISVGLNPLTQDETATLKPWIDWREELFLGPPSPIPNAVP
jgi:hypothetical protein